MRDVKYLNMQKGEQIKHYDEFKYNFSFEIFDRVKRYHVKNILNLIKARPEDDDKALHVACGRGHEINLLGKGIGADISFNCVKSIVKLGFPGIVCDVENLPFINDHFDYVFSNSMHHFDNFEKAFGEIYRVCKKGGRIVLWPESHRCSLDQYIYNTVFRYWKVEKGVLKLTPRKLIKLFKNHKLNNVQYYHKGIDPIAVNPAIEKIFDGLTEILPNSLFFWAHFYITGVK